MKVVILGGSVCSRLAGESGSSPKSLLEIAGRPVLWHVMQLYSHFFQRDFVIGLGPGGDRIKRYMVDYCSLSRDLTVDLRRGAVLQHGAAPVDWQVELIDTGQTTCSGGRIKRLASHLGDQTFMLTRGDAVCDVDIQKLLDFHRNHGKLATVTSVRPPVRLGLDLEGDRVVGVDEELQLEAGWINGACCVLEPGVLDSIDADDTVFETETLERLAAQDQLMAYRHEGFWRRVDAPRDQRLLDRLWDAGRAPWKIWKD